MWTTSNQLFKKMIPIKMWYTMNFFLFTHAKFACIVCICYLDENWLIPKISACRTRIWSMLVSERSERVTNFIFCRAGWYFSVSIIFTFRWHFYHPKSTINTDTSIFVFSREKLHDSKHSKYASLKP